jgi:hypothetical protein
MTANDTPNLDRFRELRPDLGITAVGIYGAAVKALHDANQPVTMVALVAWTDARQPPPSSPEWREFEDAYHRCPPRPTQLEVADAMGTSETSVRRLLRAHGISRWKDVHARIR